MHRNSEERGFSALSAAESGKTTIDQRVTFVHADYSAAIHGLVAQQPVAEQPTRVVNNGAQSGATSGALRITHLDSLQVERRSC